MSSTDDAPARCPAKSVQEYLDQDSRPVPPTLRYQANDVLGDEDIPIDRYLSPEWAAAELERLWRRVWQFACLEDELTEAGDHVVYDIGTDSVIVVRTRAGALRAFVNACLHRGRKLRTSGGHVARFRCPFHGFTWNLDGSFKGMPCKWDFPHVRAEEFGLPEVRVGTWRGFVFVNLDPDAVPLSEHLGTFPRHFVWPVETRYKSLHVGKVLPCNWKVAQDAFVESYHVIATHPQLLPWLADANSQYDATLDQPHWSRMINIQGAPSPHLADTVSEARVLESFLAARSTGRAESRDLKIADGEALPDIPAGATARQVLAERMRRQLTAGSGEDHAAVSDSELLDAIHHLVFPNFHPWGGAKGTIVYRFRPNGSDPASCLVEVLFLSSPPDGGPKPPPAPARWLSERDRFADVPELGVLGPVFDQDCENLGAVQEGLAATRKPGITLAGYQESRIRHFNRTLDSWMAGRPPT